MIQLKTRLTVSKTFIDLTPLVDVIFLMLIFFMLTSNLMPLKAFKVEQPTLERESPEVTTQLVISMGADHVVHLGNSQEVVDLSSLKSRLLAEVDAYQVEQDEAEPTIVLSVDKQADYGAFLQLFSIAQECSSRVRLVYQAPKSDLSG